MHAGADAKMLETVLQMRSSALPWMPAVRWPYSISCVSEGLVTSHDECSPLLQYLHQDTVTHATVDHYNVVEMLHVRQEQGPRLTCHCAQAADSIEWLTCRTRSPGRSRPPRGRPS